MYSSLQVQIVTYNSEDVIAACLEGLLQQTMLPNRVMIIDNASTDQTKKVMESYQTEFHEKNILFEIIYLPLNSGYAAAHNQGIKAAVVDQFDYISTLNPDVQLAPDYFMYTISDFRLNAEIGGVTGKLLRPHLHPSPTVIDSAGLRMELFYHVRDRGQDESDHGQYDVPGYVWGICGAAAVYRTKMLEALTYQGQFFDESYFLYKEDVDLCWRGNGVGWKFYYEPRTFAWHQRGWKKGQHISDQAQIHSFANQIALLVKNVPRFTPMLVLSILVESIRWIGMVFRSPGTAIATLKKIHSTWAKGWAWRKVVRH